MTELTQEERDQIAAQIQIGQTAGSVVGEVNQVNWAMTYDKVEVPPQQG